MRAFLQRRFVVRRSPHRVDVGRRAPVLSSAGEAPSACVALRNRVGETQELVFPTITRAIFIEGIKIGGPRHSKRCAVHYLPASRNVAPLGDRLVFQCCRLPRTGLAQQNNIWFSAQLAQQLNQEVVRFV